MRKTHRLGKVNQLLIAALPPIIFLAGLILYNVFRFVMPAAFSVDKTRKVEALEVMGGISPLSKNGLPIPQPQSLRAGGTSKLVISRPAADGDYLLVSGVLSASFLKSKIELDRMLHLNLSKNDVWVESDGERVEAFVLLPREYDDPLEVDDPTTDPNDPVFYRLYQNPVLLTTPQGSASGGSFFSDNGMEVKCESGTGTTGTLGMPAVQLLFTMDPDSSAWVTISRNYRVQHTAIGTADLALGVLIPRDAPGEGSFQIVVLGESVASIGRR